MGILRTTTSGGEPHSLAPLVGSWTIRGRTVGALEDDIAGECVTTWSPDHAFLEQRSVLRVGAHEIHSLEVIRPVSGAGPHPSWVFSGGSAEPLPYQWYVEGSVFVHRGLGATYRGRLSPDHRTLSGSWRPDDPSQAAPGSGYDAVMTRVDSA